MNFKLQIKNLSADRLDYKCRKQFLVGILSLGFGILFISYSFGASISDLSSIGVGARSLGLGRAHLGFSSDSYSIFINPAGLAEIKSLNIGSMRGALLGDVNYSVMSIANPFPIGSLGLGIIYSQIPQIPLTRWVASNGLTRPETYSFTDYNSGLAILSYALSFKKISFGTNIKYFSQGLSNSSGSLEGGSGTGANMDIGIQFRANPWLTLGGVVSNFIPASMGGKFVWQKNNVSETMPQVIKAGAALRLLGENGLRQFALQEAVFLFDIEKGVSSGGSPFLLHSGIEWRPQKTLYLRAGLDQQEGVTNSKSDIESNMTYGIGLVLSPITFDYSYHRYGDLADNSSHYFSLGYSFDGYAKNLSGEKIDGKEKIINFLKNLFKDEE